jgi:cold-inducible RNA-binding protein
MNRRLYVGNLAYTVTGDQLKDLFAAHGEVVEATMISDRVTGRSKGFGFVEMATDEGAKKAIENLNEQEVGGRKIMVNEAKERDAQPPRPRFGGGGGGRGR